MRRFQDSVAVLSVICLLLGPQEAWTEEAREEEASEEELRGPLPFHAGLQPRFRSRWGPGISDQEVFGYVWGEVGDARLYHVTASALARLMWDADGRSEEGNGSLTNLDTTFENNRRAFARVYHAYVTAHEFGPVEWLRLGRQIVEESVDWLLRTVAAISKWSMLDVFIVALLVVALEGSLLTTADIHVGIVLFAAAVVTSTIGTHRLVAR